MDKIDKYINSIYRDISDSSKETKDLKQEMRNHLNQSVKELQENGISEEESIRIAIERFGEVLQIRTELNHVLRFQKLFAQKIRIASLILLTVSFILLITAFFVNQSWSKRFNIMNSQFNLVQKKFENEGITSVDKYLKEIFKDEENNQLTFVSLKEITRNHELGKTKYSYPLKIENTYNNDGVAHEVTINNSKFLLELEFKNFADKNNSGLYFGLAIIIFSVWWILCIIWSIIKVYSFGELNSNWCILLILTGIIGYFIFSIIVNPNNVINNRRNNIIYINIFFIVIIASVLYYIFKNTYIIRELYYYFK